MGKATRNTEELDWIVSINIHDLSEKNIYIYSLLPHFCLLRGPKSSNTPVSISTLSSKVLASKCHFPVKKHKRKQGFGEFVDSRVGVTNVQNKPGKLLCHKSKEVLNMQVKGSQVKLAKSDALSIKINKDGEEENNIPCRSSNKICKYTNGKGG